MSKPPKVNLPVPEEFRLTVTPEDTNDAIDRLIERAICNARDTAFEAVLDACHGVERHGGNTVDCIAVITSLWARLKAATAKGTNNAN